MLKPLTTRKRGAIGKFCVCSVERPASAGTVDRLLVVRRTHVWYSMSLHYLPQRQAPNFKVNKKIRYHRNMYYLVLDILPLSMKLIYCFFLFYPTLRRIALHTNISNAKYLINSRNKMSIKSVLLGYVFIF